jgi:amino acid adenylation domain-containing protein
MREVAAFLQVPYHPAMLQPYAGGRMTDGITASSRMLGDVKFHQHQGIDPSVSRRWQTASHEDFLGEMTWQVAQTLGYRREKSWPAPAEAPSAVEQPLPPIPRHPRQEPQVFPLSFAQQRLWFLEQLEPSSTAYLVPSALRLSGKLEVQALERSFQELLHRHESLRTTFALQEGQPVQIIHSAGEERERTSSLLTVIDLQGLQPERQEREARHLADQEGQRPCDLEQGPLWRTSLLQLEPHEQVLLLTLHHIITDGWSNEVLMRELTTLYRAFVAGQSSPLAPLPIQYADYALWQRQWLQGDTLEEHLAYWRTHLAKVPPLALPTDHPRPAVQTHRGTRLSWQLPAALSQNILNLSQQQEVTLFMLLLAAFQVLLLRYTGQSDISVGTPVANRRHAAIEGVIGFFVNTLVLRTDLSGNPTFQQVLQRVHEVCLGAYAHQDIPFEKVVEELAPTRDLSRSPLFQVMLVLHNAQLPYEQGTIARRVLAATEEDSKQYVNSSVTEQELVTTRFASAKRVLSKFDLTLSVAETGQRLHGILEYNTDLFEEETIRRMLDHWQTLLEGIVQRPQVHISDLQLLSEHERALLLVHWNATQADYPQELCVHQLFEQQVERTPDAVALVFGEQALTYTQLNQRANQLARYLQELGVGPEVLVGLYLERSLQMVVALLAVLKAGGTYVPLDTSYPSERLTYMLEEAQVLVVVTTAAQQADHKLAVAQARVVCLDRDWSRIDRYGSENRQSDVQTENLAYVIYTSGSTGRPKGVMISHRGLTNYLWWARKKYRAAEGTGALLHSSIGFDLTVTSLFMPLLAGQRVVIVPEEPGIEPLGLALRNERNLSLVKLTPSHLEGLNHYLPAEELVDGPQVLILGGEALWNKHLTFWQTYSSRTRLINEYGPTETVVGCCAYEVARGATHEGAIPIGRPIANMQMYVLDAMLQPTVIGVTGELYIGGRGVARGYWGHPEMTAERFIPHPFSHTPGERLYRTGDLARYLPDGNLEYLGRVDQQVKIRGYRVELGEIEAVLGVHPAIQNAVVLTQERSDVQRLVAYLVFQPGQSLSSHDLRSYLQDRLPTYMIPSTFVPLEALPLTANGKVDRQQMITAAPNTSNPPLSLIDTEHMSKRIPRDTIEWHLLQIWEDVLARQPVSVLDNFFDLGGHSLLAVRLMSRISEHFGLALDLAILFQHPTVAELAAVLRRQIIPEKRSPLVALQPRGNRPPFFCVHPAGGNVFCYVNLARCLGPDQPFYGLQMPDQREREEVLETVEKIASRYIAAIRTVQPQGPYLLGGWSVGGVIAFEMAQQLRRQGDEVGLLAIIDSDIADAHVRAKALEEGIDLGDAGIVKELIRRYKANMTDHSELIIPDDFEQRNPDEQSRYIVEIGKKMKVIPSDASYEEIQKYIRMYRANGYITSLYVPQDYQDCINYFSSSEPTKHTSLSDELEYETVLLSQKGHLRRWHELAKGGMEVSHIPGNHFDIIEEPSVQVLAKELKSCIDRLWKRGEIKS